MDPQLYIEVATNIEAARLEEWIGREYARSLSQPYPVPPDTWIPPPATPPPEAYTWFYSRCIPRVPNGGVYVLYDDVLAFATQPQTLSDGSSFGMDLGANAKTYSQLTAAGQHAVDAPPT